MKTPIPHAKLSGAIALSSLLASVGLIGGLGIQSVKQELITFLPLLIALPAMNAMAGDYATVTAAHLADPENYRSRTKKLLLAYFVSLPISCLGVIAVSLGAAHLKGFAVDSTTTRDFAVQITATLYAVTILIFALIFIANRLLVARKINVDDTLLPIANTVASVITLGAFAFIANSLA